jgi:hypothetical protein
MPSFSPASFPFVQLQAQVRNECFSEKAVSTSLFYLNKNLGFCHWS